MHRWGRIARIFLSSGLPPRSDEQDMPKVRVPVPSLPLALSWTAVTTVIALVGWPSVSTELNEAVEQSFVRIESVVEATSVRSLSPEYLGWVGPGALPEGAPADRLRPLRSLLAENPVIGGKPLRTDPWGRAIVVERQKDGSFLAISAGPNGHLDAGEDSDDYRRALALR